MIDTGTTLERARATLAFIRVTLDQLENGAKLEDIIASDEAEFIAKVHQVIASNPLLPAEIASQLVQCILQIEQHVIPAMAWQGTEKRRTARVLCQVLLEAARAESDPVFHMVRHKFYQGAFFQTNNALHHLFDVVATLEALLDSDQEMDVPIGRG